MPIGNVGAGILNIITESLYDKPIVVFREYVQNSIDSFLKIHNSVDKNELVSKIWLAQDNIYFLDNGKGIDREKFEKQMKDIGMSEKIKAINIGYKGIGRLSGIPYCKRLIFINICSYKNNSYQKYSIDGEKYNEIKKKYEGLTFDALMERIGMYVELVSDKESGEIRNVLKRYQDIFEKQDTGFLVILDTISPILKETIGEDNNKTIFDELGWLLPVNFKDEVFSTKQKELFQDMTEDDGEVEIAPARAFNIYFNDKKIERPIGKNMLRDYVCKYNLTYAVGFQSFYRNRIAVDKDNCFSGIKIYIDNMLLCDEKELLPILQQYGLIKHTVNELIQSVKGIGAMIYITDKVNISANARRTFIEVTDYDSLEFLKLLAVFVENIYNTRYALSKYTSGKKSVEIGKDKLDALKEAANLALQKLAQEEITIIDEDDKGDKTFGELTEIEQKQAIKMKISKEVNNRIKLYLAQTTSFDYNDAYGDFKTWLLLN